MNEFRARAACRTVDPETFFPVSAAGEARAKRVCESCTVAHECLAEALETGHDGVWGGTTLDERRALRLTVIR